MGVQNFQTNEGVSFHERKILRAQSAQDSAKPQCSTLEALEEEQTEPMALSNATRDWLIKNSLEGFIRVAEAPPHEEPEMVAATIDLDGLSKVTVQAAIELPSEELHSIENPSTQILIEYFWEFSIVSKAYWTHVAKTICSCDSGVARVWICSSSTTHHAQE